MEERKDLRRKSQIRERLAELAPKIELDLAPRSDPGAMPFGAATVAVYLTNEDDTDDDGEKAIRRLVDDWINASSRERPDFFDDFPHYVISDGFKRLRPSPFSRPKYGQQPEPGEVKTDDSAFSIFPMGRDMATVTWEKHGFQGGTRSVWGAIARHDKSRGEWKFKLVTQYSNDVELLDEVDQQGLRDLLDEFHSHYFLNPWDGAATPPHMVVDFQGTVPWRRLVHHGKRRLPDK